MEIFYTKNKDGSWSASDAEGHSCKAATRELAKNQLWFLYHNSENDFYNNYINKKMKELSNENRNGNS